MTENPLDKIHTELCGCTYKWGFMGEWGNYWGRVVLDRCARHQQAWDIVQEFLCS